MNKMSRKVANVAVEWLREGTTSTKVEQLKERAIVTKDEQEVRMSSCY
jgi:hypothetical protein